jgi:hypothetical protein
MLVLIDESGDPGFKLEKGSTTHFVAAMVVFRDFKQAEACSATIKTLRQQLPHSGEFKFNKSDFRVKDGFFEAMRSHSFEVWALVVDKTRIRSENLRRNDEKFYNYFVKLLLDCGAKLEGARVKIDGSGDREFKEQLQRYLKRSLPDGAVSSVKFSDSKKDDLIQLADMVVGAIARSYRTTEERSKASRWRAMLNNKIRNCWEFK